MADAGAIRTKSRYRQEGYGSALFARAGKEQCQTEKIAFVFYYVRGLLLCGNDADVVQYG